MKLTTLCYIEKEDEVLLLHRTKKKDDPNEGKWIGVGGKLLEKESPYECVLREVKEETGLTLRKVVLRGILTFILNRWEDEITFLYTADEFEGTLINCNEGELRWIKKDQILDLNLWEGDRAFLKKLSKGSPFFSMKLVYDEQDQLIELIDEEGAELVF